MGRSQQGGDPMTDIVEAAAEAAIPGLGEAKAAMMIAKAAWPFLVALGVLAAVAGIWLHVRHLEADLAAARAETAKQHGVATVQTGQTAAAGDAAKIIDAGRAKADVTVHIQQENRSALLADPGAGQVIDPGLAADLSRRLCAYAAYRDDPGCAEVRAPDPGQLPQAGAGNAAPASPSDGWDVGRRFGQPNGPA
jgi:hypothetical protein